MTVAQNYNTAVQHGMTCRHHVATGPPLVAHAPMYRAHALLFRMRHGTLALSQGRILPTASWRRAMITYETRYQLTDLGAVPDIMFDQSRALAITNAGQVVGNWYSFDGTVESRGFLASKQQ